MTSAPRSRFSTLVFDVFGTVVDEAGTIAAETVAALEAGDVDPAHAERLTAEWSHQLGLLLHRVRIGEAAWRTDDDLRRDALREALVSAEVPELPAAVVERLARVGHRMRPWPDSPEALRTLAGTFTVVALSNGTLGELADLSAAGGLAWHCVLSAELVGAYKPDPAVYRLALDRLELDPNRTLMVAAHPWDLRGAAAQGMKTAYVARPGEAVADDPHEFDLHAGDLRELAAMLAR